MKKKMLIILALLSNLAFAQSWEFVGLDSMVIYSLQVKGDTIWAGTYDFSINNNSGLYKSIDQGQLWVELDSSLGTGTIASFSIDENNSSIIYMIEGVSSWSNSGNFFKTTNNGEYWDNIETPYNSPIKDFILSSFNSNEYYVISNTLGHEWSTLQLFFKSTNGGENWEYECCPGNQEFGIIMNFTMDNIDPNVLYLSAASATEFVSRSTDRGVNWETLSGQPVSKIYSDSFIPNRLYLWGYQYNSYSNDGGYTWQSMQGEFSEDAIFISFYQDNISSLIYILMDEGLFYSANDSIYWKLIPGSDDLPLVTSSYSTYSINSISIDHVNNYTYVGTSNGIYRTGIVTAIDESESQLTVTNYSLAQNYPNPFNPSTSIQYALSSMQFVTLRIYDVLGNEIATLVNEVKDPGYYQVNFNASNFTSGVYFYRLVAGSFVSSRKMLLLK